MSKRLQEIFGTLDECDARVQDLESHGWIVNVSYAAPMLIERPYQLGSGTGERMPVVKKWHMILHTTRGDWRYSH